MIKFKRRFVPVFLLPGILFSTLPAPLASAQSMMLEEIIVTARKRAESLQSAPLSVSALSGDTLRDAGITNLADVTEIVPNLQISRPSRDASIYIRGVGPTRGATNVTELSVGVYIDDVFMLKPHGQLMDLAEVQLVQVLRGPQGTLFGKNTTGGALSVTTVKPAEELGGFAQITVGNDGRQNAQASIDVPLGDSLFSKLTVTRVKDDGFGKDPVHGTNLSDEDRIGGLFQLRWLASDTLTADFSLFHNRITENLLAMGDCVTTNSAAQIPANGLFGPSSGRQISEYCDDVRSGISTYSDPNRRFELDANQASVNIDWAFSENHSVKSVTAWRQQETPNIDYTNTYAGFPAGQRSIIDGESTQFSQEFQFNGEFYDGRLRYTGGLFYMDDDSDTGLRASWNGDNGVWGFAAGPDLIVALYNYNQSGQVNENTTAAVYTQWSWDASSSLELTAGLRYGYEDRDISTQRADVVPDVSYEGVPGVTTTIPGLGALISREAFFANDWSQFPLTLGENQRLMNQENFDSLTPMVSAAYSFPDVVLGESVNNLMVYASYTAGYKAGGFSDFNDGVLTPFEEEEIDSIEVGLKMEAMDNRLRLNASIFSMEYDNMQLFVARPDPDPNNIGSLQGVTNAGASSIDGFEMELTVLPAAGWLINLTASLADGEFKQFDDFTNDPVLGVVELDRSDEDLPSLPESSYSLAVQYNWDIGQGNVTARVDAYFRDEIYWGFDAATWDLPIARENSITDSYTVFNARINWQINESLSLTAWGKNLSDEVYYDGGVGETANIGHVIKAFSPPRRYGVDIRYDF